MKHLRIALAQMNSTVGDFSGNLQKIEEAIKKAGSRQADLIAFPEMAITGYPPEDLLLKPNFIDENRKGLDAMIPMGRGMTVIVGFIDRTKDLYNAAAIIHDGTLAFVYHKWHLPNYGVFDENRYFSAGQDAPVFSLNGIRIGVNICEDIWHADGPIKQQVENGGAELIVNINASPYHLRKGQAREAVLAKRAKDHQVQIAYVNMVGGQDELVFDGGSLVFNQAGKRLARAPQFEEALLFLDLPFDGAARSTLPLSLGHRKGATQVVSGSDQWIFQAAGLRSRRTLTKGSIAKKRTWEDELYRALTLGLSDYVSKNRFKKVVMGLSGGIDSALTAVLAADALGRKNVVLVFMPSRYTSNQSAQDAKTLAKNLGIRLIVLPIEGPFGSTRALLSDVFAETETDITEENLQSRIRGNILMALSNKFGWLVLTTGNKSELSVGYTTLYGDMAGGFAVIKDLWKGSVYRLARYRNKRADAPIPSSIFEKPPTAELRSNQCDQDSLPPYDILDPILQAYVEQDKDIAEIVALGFEPETVSNVIGLVDASEFKRRQAPVGIKISPRAFGKDRRMPITNRYGTDYQADEGKNISSTTKKRRKKIA
ncbi:MAG: NAD+ synthase [Nitrospiria bacterium]